MKCKHCEAEGETSELTLHTSHTTLMCSLSYYDEEGRFHHHDPNTKSDRVTCSRGHSYEHRATDACWCGWKAEGYRVTTVSPD